MHSDLQNLDVQKWIIDVTIEPDPATENTRPSGLRLLFGGDIVVPRALHEEAEIKMIVVVSQADVNLNAISSSCYNRKYQYIPISALSTIQNLKFKKNSFK